MKRTLYNKLLDWKHSATRKPLILEGARQVGKTWLLQEFGRNEYENMVYVNFHENPKLDSLFIDFDIDRILISLSAISGQTIKPGKTLIFLDEIQESKNAVPSLKYFCENAPQQHVVVAGSLLGVSNLSGQSYPVGKVDTLRLYPMTFGEFLLAKDKRMLYELLETLDWNTLNPLNDTLTGLLRQYYFVGGMPEAVKAFVDRSDPNEVRHIQLNILDAYEKDFAKHADRETQRIRMVWESIPAQLARENKKFIFGAVKKSARASTFEIALQWLKDAGLTHRVARCTQPVRPLKFYEDRDTFKVYVLDVGLLGAMTEAAPGDMLNGNSVFVEFKGALTENYVLQQLLTTGAYHPYYFSKDNSTQEIDFLIQTDSGIVPIEVKAEENVKSKSLTTFINIDHKDKNLKAVRFSMLDHIDQGWVENIPLWAVESWGNHQPHSTPSK